MLKLLGDGLLLWRRLRDARIRSVFILSARIQRGGRVRLRQPSLQKFVRLSQDLAWAIRGRTLHAALEGANKEQTMLSLLGVAVAAGLILGAGWLINRCKQYPYR
jgi:hypothetical protein